MLVEVRFFELGDCAHGEYTAWSQSIMITDLRRKAYIISRLALSQVENLIIGCIIPTAPQVSCLGFKAGGIAAG